MICSLFSISPLIAFSFCFMRFETNYFNSDPFLSSSYNKQLDFYFSSISVLSFSSSYRILYNNSFLYFFNSSDKFWIFLNYSAEFFISFYLLANSAETSSYSSLASPDFFARSFLSISICCKSAINSSIFSSNSLTLFLYWFCLMAKCSELAYWSKVNVFKLKVSSSICVDSSLMQIYLSSSYDSN